MSVQPTSFAADGGVQVWHDEAGHGGAVPFASLTFARNADGSVNPDFLVVPCPVAGCGAVSVHPCSGGADAPRVELLFVRTVLRRAAALGIPTGQRTFAAIKSRVKARAEAMDGVGRWRLDALQGEDDSVPAD